MTTHMTSEAFCRKPSTVAAAQALHWDKARAAAVLARGRWFGGLPDSFQAEIVEASEIVTIARRRALFRAGDSVTGLYAALEGDLRIYVGGEGGEQIFVGPLGPTSWFGDLLDNRPKRNFDVYAASPSAVLFLPKARYEVMTGASPALYRAFVALHCLHAAYAAHAAVEARSNAPVRMARALLRLASAHGRPTDRGTELAVRISQSDLASLVGVSRQYVNSLIASWNAEGVLAWKANGHHVIACDRLAALVAPFDSWNA